MSYGKEMWIAEYERILDEFGGGKIDRETAEQRLRHLGLDEREIGEQLDGEGA